MVFTLLYCNRSLRNIPVNTSHRPNAFSLIEVVFALAIFVFAGFALVGLLGVGLSGSQDSRARTQAATIAENYCSTLRAAPTNDFTATSSPIPGFPIKPLTTSPNQNDLTAPYTYLTKDGITTNAANADFGFLYNITPSGTSPGYATAYFCFYWPPQASPTVASTSHFELTTTFALP